MKIYTLIQTIKANSGSVWNGREICADTTRDKVLWGDAGQECTGIISTCYASPAVIKKAMELGCNFIVVHEALFWNHGDRTDWLEKNTAFRKKKALLEESGVCIWRYHDYVHAGIRVDGALHDGIFHGLSSLLGWNEYQTDKNALLCHDFCLPRAWTVQEMASFLTKKFHLEGVRFIGNPAAKIRKVQVSMHILGHLSDDRIIEQINEEDINCLLTLEMVDFTVCEYIRDAAMLGEDRCIFAVGHFNIEEIGMEYLATGCSSWHHICRSTLCNPAMPTGICLVFDPDFYGGARPL